MPILSINQSILFKKVKGILEVYLAYKVFALILSGLNRPTTMSSYTPTSLIYMLPALSLVLSSCDNRLHKIRRIIVGELIFGVMLHLRLGTA